MDRNYAVFTGDILSSTTSSPDKLERTMSLIAATATSVEATTGLSLRFSRHRGDGWQLCLADVSKTWLTLVLILTSLREDPLSLETRISIGIGPAESVGTDDLSDARGFAFTISGRGLDHLQQYQRRPRKARKDDPLGVTSNRWLSLTGDVEMSDLAILEFIAHLSEHWTSPQATALRLSLLHPEEKQEELAARLGISRQALTARLKGAGHTAIQLAILANRIEARETAHP